MIELNYIFLVIFFKQEYMQNDTDVYKYRDRDRYTYR